MFGHSHRCDGAIVVHPCEGLHRERRPGDVSQRTVVRDIDVGGASRGLERHVLDHTHGLAAKFAGHRIERRREDAARGGKPQVAVQRPAGVRGVLAADSVACDVEYARLAQPDRDTDERCSA